VALDAPSEEIEAIVFSELVFRLMAGVLTV